MSTTADPYDLIVIGAGMAGAAAAEKCVGTYLNATRSLP